MSKKLIELINKSNLIIIYGNVGSGRNLLLRKLFNNPNLLGKEWKNIWGGKQKEDYFGDYALQTPQGDTCISNPEEAISWLKEYSDLGNDSEKINVFLNIFDKKYEEDDKIKEFIRQCNLAKHHSQRLFLSLDERANNYDEIQKEIRGVVDLWIKSCGVSSNSELHLEIMWKKQKFKEKVVVTRIDIQTELTIGNRNEYLQWKKIKK